MGKRRPRKKGLRRSHLKRFSSAMVNCGSGPNANAIAEYHERTKSLRFGENPWFENKYVGVQYTREELLRMQNPRAKALDDARKLAETGRAFHDLRQWHKQVLVAGVTMYWWQSVYLFVEEKTKRGVTTVRRSRDYKSRALAMGAFSTGKITWFEVKSG